MGSITFQGIGDASIGTKTKTYTVSDSDMNRFKVWAIAKFATPPTVANPNPPTLTVAQALSAWADWCILMTKTDMIQRQRDADVAAVPLPPPFVAT